MNIHKNARLTFARRRGEALRAERGAVVAEHAANGDADTTTGIDHIKALEASHHVATWPQNRLGQLWGQQ